MLKDKILNFIYILIKIYLLSVLIGGISTNKLTIKDVMEGKVVGGEPISLNQLPYSVQLFNQGSMCAGTILNSWSILTAAHCFDINKDIDEMIIQVGSRYVYDFNAEQYNVANLVIHNKYNRTGLFACDIALIFVDRPITFSNQTKKTILVTNEKWMSPTETNFSVSGWGWTQYGGPVSTKGLMMARLRFIPLSECSQLHNLDMTPDMFCLYGDGSRDTCKGDSGGGVFWNGMMVGITSHGDGCAKKQKPSVYVNVFHFKDWIQKEVLYYVDVYCRIIK